MSCCRVCFAGLVLSLALLLPSSISGQDDDAFCAEWEKWIRENAEDARNAQCEHSLCGPWSFERLVVDDPDSGRTEIENWVGLRLFAPGYYAVLRMDADRPRFRNVYPDWRSTDAEKLANHETFIANTGSWCVRGDSLVTKIVAAKWPNFSGKTRVWTFSVSGDTLRMSFNPAWRPVARVSETWVRAAPGKGGQ